MIVYVVDANIFIDLIYAELLDQLPHLGLQFATTSFILDELETGQQLALEPLVLQGCLVIHEISSVDEIGYSLPQGLSLPDKSAICLAFQEGANLLSGDGLVRKTAEKIGLNVYGLLWLLEEFVALKILEPDMAIIKLKFLVEEKGSRQPLLEYLKRIEIWKNINSSNP